MTLESIIKVVMALIGVVALLSLYSNLHAHQFYAVASRLALFSAALTGFVNPAPFAKLIRNSPFVALAIGLFFLALIIGFYLLFFVIFKPPQQS